MSLFKDAVQRGTRAAQPAATAVVVGALYYVTDESKTERSNGAAWQDVSDAAGSGITQLTGDVTAGPGTGSQAATIAADAVTYAKMQNVSAASKLLGRGDSGSGDPQEITLGTGLAMAGTTMSATGGGSAGLVLLEKHDASGSASLDFTTRNATGQSGATFQSDYDEYLIEFVDLAPATNNVDLLVLLSTNGGSSYDAGTNYARQTRLDQSTFNTVAGGNSGLTALVAITNVSNGSTFGLNLSGKIWAPGSAAHYKPFTFQGVYRNNDGSFYSVVGSGVYLSATAVNAFQAKFSSGNIASGSIRVYGIVKS